MHEVIVYLTVEHVVAFFQLVDPQDENKIGIDGIQQFCDDLSLDPTSITVLVVAWKFRAATQCEFSKKEFMDGMTELGWESIIPAGFYVTAGSAWAGLACSRGRKL